MRALSFRLISHRSVCRNFSRFRRIGQRRLQPATRTGHVCLAQLGGLPSCERLAEGELCLDLYRVLGVDQGASVKQIKAAFKKQALKLHPDVNKAPDAAEKFKKLRNAYQILSDAETRAEHDRKIRMGSGFDWEPPSFSSRPRTPYQSEPIYGLEDVFRDLGEAFSEFGAGSQASEDGIGSLWEELESLGQEFVEFLEQEAGISPPPKSSSGSPPVNPTKETTQPREPQRPPRKSVEDDVEETLQELKRKLGL